MTGYERRPALGAYLEPGAVLAVLREFGAGLEQLAAGLSGSPDEADRQIAREIRTSLGRMREVRRQMVERRRPLPSGSAGGSAEVVEGVAAARSSHPPWSPVDAVLSTGEVAGQLGVCRRQVTNLIGGGKGPLPATKRGGQWFVAQTDLDDYLNFRRTG